ncbi:4'-phosphopantetheinyl transferase superfamily protein [Flavobacteriaceae bacterium]|nr:4'-phosphopantetheinyl transferase superfamily protein [Flavobacteriaceae bacterium]MDA8763268.1 4'-phosphopantetheinyl transferase superfamily protein [Flavobacteriaceae bacterium]
MPLKQRVNIDEQTQILIWQIEETLEALQKNLKLSKADKIRFQKRKIISHQKEFLASRRLLLEAGVSPEGLSHDPDGIPHLESGQQLSISHTKNLAGIALGSQPLGIDLEVYRPKIERIAPRFLHAEENYALESPMKIEKLSLIWTAKEALYKALKQKGIVFSEQLLVAPFQWGDPRGSAKVFISDKTLDFSLNFIVRKAYCGTLATQKI